MADSISSRDSPLVECPPMVQEVGVQTPDEAFCIKNRNALLKDGENPGQVQP
jgi:hypothetical protein